MTVLAAALAIFLRAIQQQNVIGGHYLAACLTSYGIALADVLVVLRVIDDGASSILEIGTGGAIGVCLAMWMHKRVRDGIYRICRRKATQ